MLTWSAASQPSPSLGADSLDLIELTMVPEQHFVIAIGDHGSEGYLTVGDALSFLDRKRSERSREAA